MRIMHEQCAGLDVHQKTVVACRMYQSEDGKLQIDKQTFRTMTKNLKELRDWLFDAGITHVALESTGDYWKPVYNILEELFEVWVVNAQHVKNVPGRKTDANDAEWLTDLMRHGLVRASFIPNEGQRHYRDLTRMRLILVRERATFTNRLHKALESCNIKLSSVASDLRGRSCVRMLYELVTNIDARPEDMADMALGTLRRKHDDLVLALEGFVADHDRFMLGQLLDHIANLDARIAAFEQRIEAASAPYKEAVALIDTVPAISTIASHAIISEIGSDMTRFPTAGHLASWLGLCPGNNQSGGKRLSGRTRKGNVYARAALVQVAHVVCRMSETQYYSLYRRIAARRGKKRALIAVAHAIIVTIWHLLTNKKEYVEPGPNYLDLLRPERELNIVKRRAAALGHMVVPVPQAA